MLMKTPTPVTVSEASLENIVRKVLDNTEVTEQNLHSQTCFDERQPFHPRTGLGEKLIARIGAFSLI